MTKIFISLTMMTISFMMYPMNHPMSMGMMILIQSMLTCLISGMMINSYWFSYILFLTFLGGLLVLFIYMSSIASNEIFKISNNYLIIFTLMMMTNILISIYFMYNLNWMNFSSNNEMNNFFSIFSFFNNEEKINLSKLYNNQTFLLMLMMIIYLLITLLAVVKITNIFYGPIRSSLY
uniref:NADH-ubiquinone oxidoreductase chain 6 n=1 Tax=Plutella xylostella TaxID=51655 RepID=A0A0U1XEL3_PLUXY|nr:NADH dehydrogenase subunit 6 [Plutella xylostella]AIS35861.1 NADH dehydrogenase subunit 6 [Plutella xylostella]